MTHYKEPIKINITASPKELRALADRMEQSARCVTLGQTCFVDFLAYDKEYIVSLLFDQERTKGSPNFRHE